MNTNSAPIVKYRFNSNWENDVRYLEVSGGRPSFVFRDCDKLMTFTNIVSACLVLSSIENKADILEVSRLMEAIQKAENSVHLKVIVINFSGNPEVSGILSKLGVQEILEHDLTFEAFKERMDFWLAGLDVDAEESNVDLLLETPSVSAQIVRGQEIFPCEINDFIDKNFMFNLGKEGLKANDQVYVEIKFNYLSRESSFKINGMVTTVDLENKLTSIEITDSELPELKELLSVFDERQKNVNIFLDTIKGQ